MSVVNSEKLLIYLQDTDPNHGFVDYQTEANARGSLGLISVNQYGQAFMGVDHATNLVGASVRGRPAVRVQSKKTYSGGLFIADIQHMPGKDHHSVTA